MGAGSCGWSSGLGVRVSLDRGPHAFQQRLRQHRPGHPRRRPGPVTRTAYPPRQRRRGRWRRRVGDWGLGTGASGPGLGGWGLGGASGRSGRRLGGGRFAWRRYGRLSPWWPDDSRDGVSEDACSSSRLAPRPPHARVRGKTPAGPAVLPALADAVDHPRHARAAARKPEPGRTLAADHRRSSGATSVPVRSPSGEGSASAVCPSASGARRDRGGTLRPFPILLNPPGGRRRAPSCGTAEHTASYFST